MGTVAVHNRILISAKFSGFCVPRQALRLEFFFISFNKLATKCGNPYRTFIPSIEVVCLDPDNVRSAVRIIVVQRQENGTGHPSNPPFLKYSAGPLLGSSISAGSLQLILAL